MRARNLALMALLLLPSTAMAHDTWLVAAKYRLKAKENVKIQLATSEAFPTSDGAVKPDRVAQFHMRSRTGKQAVSGYQVEGNFLAVEVKAGEGQTVVTAETKPRFLEMKAADFNDYIGHEELKQILAAREKAGKTESPGRELYRKIAKVVLCAEGADNPAGQGEGLWLEIVPERNVCGVRQGEVLWVRVLHRGRPLPGAFVAAGYEGVTGHKYPVWVKTDARGRAQVKLDRAGAWFVRTLHMVAHTNPAEADWESAFSTVTFEVREGKVQAAIRGVLEAQDAAWNRGDVETYMQGYWNSEELIFAGTSGVQRGWQAVLERYRESYPDRAAMGHLTFDGLEINMLGPDAAMVLGNWKLAREKEPIGGVFTLVMRKFAEGWKIVADHTSVVAGKSS